MRASTRALNAFAREAVLSASPARLLVMLFDRLMLDMGRAEAAQTAEQWDVARENLMHAQEIIGELSGSLDLDAWDGAAGLLGIYSYAGTALMNANIYRNVELTRECIGLLEPLRQSWHDAAAAPAIHSGVSPRGDLG
ncbi:flagellar export chaperone FliS [Arthrobacter cryoconiti]|uniref:Flagellar export chaperone FliS n=1 Tax=Arthrobacter cryoconiti TaxID=748907 RepID=A0ABV8QYC6_9MICC|nr:flagellar export chaperone FliS [Arthrobacter cryoconiti]MCC9067333.1 flagellar export chaperone FliS [Arthrobacter cryoconiti]